MEEIWRDIAGFEGYKVSNKGRVMSFLRYKEGEILKMSDATARKWKEENKYGKYIRVCLSRDGLKKDFKVHRLVAEAKTELNIKDTAAIYACCNRKPHYNYAFGYMWRYLSEYDEREFGQYKNKPIIRTTEKGFFIQDYSSINEAAEICDLDINKLIDCLEGRTKTAFGSNWIYAIDYQKKELNRWKPVVMLSYDWTFLREYEYASEAVRNIDSTFVSSIMRSCKSFGKRTSGGYRWMYKDDYVNLIEKPNSNESD